jgi:hypothetical protein
MASEYIAPLDNRRSPGIVVVPAELAHRPKTTTFAAMRRKVAGFGTEGNVGFDLEVEPALIEVS